MPHVRTVFVEDPGIREFLRTNKTTIREAFADILGYPPEDVAFYPQKISSGDAELADNLLPLEFVVDSGTRSLDSESECVLTMKLTILKRCEGADKLHKELMEKGGLIKK